MRIVLAVWLLVSATIVPERVEAARVLGWVAVQGVAVRADHAKAAVRIAKVREGDQLAIDRYWDDWGHLAGPSGGWVPLAALRRDARPDKKRRCYDTTFNYTVCAPDWISEAITHEAARYGVERDLMMRIAACESDFKPTTIGDAGEIGVFQWMPETWESSNTVGDIHDSWNQATNAARFLSLGYGHLWTCWRRIVRDER